MKIKVATNDHHGIFATHRFVSVSDDLREAFMEWQLSKVTEAEEQQNTRLPDEERRILTIYLQQIADDTAIMDGVLVGGTETGSYVVWSYKD